MGLGRCLLWMGRGVGIVVMSLEMGKEDCDYADAYMGKVEG